MNYGERLEHALERSKKSRRELAEHINVSPQAIGMIITSAGGKERRLSTENHLKTANFLSVSPYWLSTGDGGIDKHKDKDEINGFLEEMRERKRKHLEPLVQEERSKSDLWNAVRLLRKLPVDLRKSSLDLLINSVNCDSNEASEQLLGAFTSMLLIVAQYKKDPDS